MSASDRLKNLTAKQKRSLVLGGLGAVVLVIFMGMRSTSMRSNERAPVSADNLLTNADPRALGLSSLNAEINRLRDQSNAMSAKVDELTTSKAAMQVRQDELEKAAMLRERGGSSPNMPLPPGDVVRPLGVVPGVDVEGTPTSGAQPPTDAAQTESRFTQRQSAIEAMRGNNGVPGVGPGAGMPMEVERRPAPAILTIGEPSASEVAAAAVTNAVAVKADEPEVFLPAGTIITTLLLNGMDAPTGRSAQNQPLPVLARVKVDANLPNHFFADIRECRIIGSAWGDLSSERAFIRSEILSCIRDDGGAIEVKLKAFATGEDGKFGLRGPVVEKRGQMVGRAALAGFLGAAATALQPQRIPVISTSGGSEAQYQNNTGTGAAEAAAYGGISGAADRLADYYIKRADELVPVIEISAGREVTFVVQEGMSLVLRSKSP